MTEAPLMTDKPTTKDAFEERIEAYLKAPRQWLPHCRIQHAEYQQKNAKTDEDRRYWKAVARLERERMKP